MAADDFFARWTKRKSDAQAETGPAPVSGSDSDTPATTAQSVITADEGADAVAKPLPTLEDVSELTHDSDYSVFMARGVDETVKRSAMKKLFSNPHFNIMDGLDIYIDDYNKFEPITPEILAALNHAKPLLNPLAQLQAPLMRLLEQAAPSEEAVAENEPQIVDNAQPEENITDTASEELYAPAEQASDAAAGVDQENNTQPANDKPANDNPIQSM
jgi:hypothetical protein